MAERAPSNSQRGYACWTCWEPSRSSQKVRCSFRGFAHIYMGTPDAQSFDVFLFGGILGDDPPKHRTKELHVLKCARRHLGALQMTTDTALVVSHEIIVNQRPIDSLPYVDNPDIPIADKEVISMPFRYLADPSGMLYFFPRVHVDS